MTAPVSIPEVVDVEVIRGVGAKADAPIDLVVEVPHGATTTEDWKSYEARLSSPLPARLVDFFHVNTDAGAPELGLATARQFVTAEPKRTAAVLRCRIPRTFIDCNRAIDASPEDFKSGKVTPGLMPWITSTADRALLRRSYDRYVSAVRETLTELTGDGALLLLHSYAPRDVDVEVDLSIVESLHAAYRPEVEPTWPLRPEIDVIDRALDGTHHAPSLVVDTLRHELHGVTLGDGTTYPLHPSSLAWGHVTAHPGRALCLEVRRDLLADPFEPFAQMRIASAKVDRLAVPLAAALRRFWPVVQSGSP